MHPKTCLSAVDSELPLDVLVPMIQADLRNITNAPIKKQKQAVQKLYELTDQKHQHYRVELVTKYNILDTLVDLLPNLDHRRMACLTLNNLSIPYENKQPILWHTPLLQQLWCILRDLPPAETYLACLCVRNLSQEEESRTRLLDFGSADDYLLSLLDKLVVTFAPGVLRTGKVHNSAEGLALKWAVGIIRQVSTTRASELLEYKSTLRVLLELIQYLSIHLPLHQWTQDSLPDSCLIVILHVAQTSDIAVLKELNAQDYLSGLIGKGGIHDTRTSWIQCALEGL